MRELGGGVGGLSRGELRGNNIIPLSYVPHLTGKGLTQVKCCNVVNPTLGCRILKCAFKLQLSVLP